MDLKSVSLYIKRSLSERWMTSRQQGYLSRQLHKTFWITKIQITVKFWLVDSYWLLSATSLSSLSIFLSTFFFISKYMLIQNKRISSYSYLSIMNLSDSWSGDILFSTIKVFLLFFKLWYCDARTRFLWIHKEYFCQDDFFSLILRLYNYKFLRETTSSFRRYPSLTKTEYVEL